MKESKKQQETGQPEDRPDNFENPVAADEALIANETESSPPGEAKETVETVKAEMAERILRLQADFENYRRRTRQEQSEVGMFATNNLIKELLPILDNFERALSSRPTSDPTGFSSGVDMIYRQLKALLEKNGVNEVETVGRMFDPTKHEAILRAEGSDQPEGTIIEELQKGYSAKGKVLRPALVKVAGK